MNEWGDSLVHMDGSMLKHLRPIGKYIPFYLCPSHWTAQTLYLVSKKTIATVIVLSEHVSEFICFMIQLIQSISLKNCVSCCIMGKKSLKCALELCNWKSSNTWLALSSRAWILANSFLLSSSLDFSFSLVCKACSYSCKECSRLHLNNLLPVLLWFYMNSWRLQLEITVGKQNKKHLRWQQIVSRYQSSFVYC